MTLFDLERQKPSSLACSSITGRACTLDVPRDMGNLLARSVTFLRLPLQMQIDEIPVELYLVDDTEAKILTGPVHFLKDSASWFCSNDLELVTMLRYTLEEGLRPGEDAEYESVVNNAMDLFIKELRSHLRPIKGVELVDL